MSRTIQEPLVEALRELLKSRKASTQEDICSALEKQGYSINQSRASRLLRKVGAVKVENDQGEFVYSLPREPGPATMDTPLRDLIVDVTCNEALVVVTTSPGSASLVARVLDYHQASSEILGTLAGDDTIFVTPKSIKNTDKMFREIRALLNRAVI